MKGNPEGIDLCETTTTATANDFITTIMATNAGEVSINVLAVDGLEEKNDVYVRGICGGDQMFETSVVKGTTAPTWSAPAFTFELLSDASQLELHVRDKDRFTKDDDLAVCSLSLTALVNSPGDGPYDLWVDADEEASKKEKQARIHIEVTIGGEAGMKEAGRAVLMKAFRRIDLDDSGFISAAELGDAIRCAGHNPSLAEIDDLVSRFDVNNDRGIDFEEFCTMMATAKRTRAEDDEKLVAAFQVVSDDAWMDVDAFRTLLSNHGEGLTDAEIDDLLSMADVDDGRVNCRALQDVFLAEELDI